MKTILLKIGVLHILLLLFFISLFMRTYRLDAIPYGFHEDEAYIGYNAYSLLKTGRDHNGKFLPLAIDQFGDFRPSGLHFLTIPSVVLFGLTVFATRFPVALFGALSVIVIYFLCLEFYNNKNIALFSSALLAFTPWHIIASRTTSESIVALFFTLLGIYMLLRFFREKKSSSFFLVISVLFLFCSFLFYHATRFFVPCILIYSTILIYGTYRIPKQKKILYTGALIVLFIALGLLFTFGHGGARASEIDIFHSLKTNLLLYQQLNDDALANFHFARLFHNPLSNYMEVFLTNYLAHFGIDFLFLKGGYPERYIVPYTGSFFLFEGLFFIIGFAFLLVDTIKTKKYSFRIFKSIPVVWILLAPIPAALTFEDIPHFQRAIMMIPAFTLITAYGLYVLMDSFRKKQHRQIFLFITGCFFLYSVVIFAHNYFVHEFIHSLPYRSGQSRSEGVQELTLNLKKLAGDTKPVIMTSRNENRLIFYLFFNKIDPAYYQKLGSPRQRDGMHFQNLLFTDGYCPAGDDKKISSAKPGILYVNAGDQWCPTKQQVNVTILKDIRRPDDTTVFTIVQYK